MSLRELAVLILMCTIWGFHFVVIKTTVADVPPLFYAAVRMSLLTVVLAPFLRWRPGQMIKIMAAGACFGGLNYAFMFTGLARAPASAAAVALELYVPFATILSVIFLGDRVGIKRGFGIILAIVGVAIIALFKGETATTAQQDATIGIGITLITLAAMAEASGAVLVKSIKSLSPLNLLAWFALVGNFILWPACFLLEPGALETALQADRTMLIGAILYSAIGASIIGHASYYWLLQRLPVSLVAPSGLLTTLLAVIFSIWLLGDTLTAPMILGGLFVLVGVGVILLRNSTKTPPPKPGVANTSP